MGGKVFLKKYLICVMLLLGQLHGYESCVENERKALFELKKYVISITKEKEFELKEDYVLPSWTYDIIDCCQWVGVMCNQTSNRVTGIAFGTLNLKQSSLLNLSLFHPFEEVRSLNLSKSGLSFLYPPEKRRFDYDTNNRFAGFFDDVEGYKSLGRLRNLEILDLSENRFNNSIFSFLSSATSLTTLFLRENNLDGPFPAKELSALRKLKTLDLSRNYFSAPVGLEGYKILRNLEILDLSVNQFNNSIFPFISAATSLTTLFLGSNYISDPFLFEELINLTNLELLDLSDNRFNGSIPIRELSALRKLKALDLSDNKFSGSMELQGICEMKNMQELDLSGNKLAGQFPLCFTSFSRLRVLDLSSNQLSGNVPSALGNLESLKYLSLIDNNFEGFFSVGSLANLSELRVLKLGSKSKSFQVESESSWKPKFQLSVVELPSCNLERVPYFLIYQKELSRIDLSDNKISEDFPHWLLANNTELKVLLLQNNLYTSFQLPKSPHGLIFLDVSVNKFNNLFPENIGWIFPHLQYMNLAKNGFQGSLPSSVGNMERIKCLDISHNSFHGNLQRSFVMGCYSIEILKLSHNKLSGEVFPESVNFTYMSDLSMDNNLFTGKIGLGLRRLGFLRLLDISNNSITGVIPSWIGQLLSLEAILLSNNKLEGEIPISLFKLPNLSLLDLSANNLTGNLPHYVVNSTLLYPVSLFLQDNFLSGEIPDRLPANVWVLDLRNNRLSGNIPQFTNTQYTHFLLLGGIT